MTHIADEDFNTEVARQFRLAADLLQSQGSEPFRVRAYRRAADTLDELRQPASEIYRSSGIKGLIAVPTIGRNLALAITDIADFGRWRWLDRLNGQGDPEKLLGTVAGIGPGLAESVHEVLGIESLEDLEAAAHDGRLARVPGFGPKRIQSVKECLAGRFALGRQSVDPPAAPLADILDIDLEYRTRAASGDLPTITPLRFNPTRAPWLPILHTERAGHHYTAMYSNTARAHKLGRTQDWVIIYADAPDHGQWTVVTDHTDRSSTRRVVRGFEREQAQLEAQSMVDPPLVLR